MGRFLAAATSFPTVLLTPLLVVVIGYWLVVIAGWLDPDEGGPESGFLGLPASVVLSLLVALSWFGCLAGSQLPAAVPRWLILLAAVAVASLIVWAVARLVPKRSEPSRSDFLGLTCVIRTGRVTATFGQAEVHAPDGSSAIVQVRQAGDDDLRAGSVALLFDVDPDGEFFWVIPADIAKI